jgi:PIN domain nuclease of toxin-antitoxin system
LPGFLLDTSIALIATATPELLTDPVRSAIEEGPAFLSAIVYWEVMIKAMKGTLEIENPGRRFDDTQDALGLRPLHWKPAHVRALYSLPAIHQDPFDRALIAQATAEDLVLLTTDGTIPRYATRTFRVIR